MPRKDIDYSKSVIYKIVPNDLSLDFVYVGSTTNFIKRKQNHKKTCNNNPNGKKYNFKLYDIIRQNGGWDEFLMLIIEEYPCNLKHELLLRERYFFENLNANLNSNYPNRTKKEYYEQNKETINEHIKKYYENNKEQINEKHKEYRDQNKEKINGKHKEYYEQNKEQINERHKEYRQNNKEKNIQPYTCQCSKIIQIQSKSRHIKSIYHQNYILNNPSQSN